MMIMKTTSDNPWEELPRSRGRGDYNTRMVAPDVNPDAKRIYWAKGRSNYPAFLVEYDSSETGAPEPPKFKNISIRDIESERSILLELQDQEMKAQFLRLCLDIADSVQKAPTVAMRKMTFMRLEKWASFLRPGRGPLTAEQQKGLIGELLFLKRVSTAIYEPSNALSGWTGPERSKHDFGYGQVFVEVKSKRGSSNSEIGISSEEQLNTNESERLFLYVVELNSATDEDKAAFSLTDVVNDVQMLFDNPLDLAHFQEKLSDAGYFPEDDYSHTLWSEGVTEAYEVKDGFPRIVSSSCPPGVKAVTYKIDLGYCSDYEVDQSAITQALR